MSEFKKFLEAIKNNDFQTLTYLWEDKELLNMQDENGDTLLHHTLKLKNIIIIQMFIGFGADLNIKNNNGITALDLLKELNNPIINAIVNSIDYDDEDDYDIIYCNNMYKPKNKEELMELVEDENINLGSIDTSLITDMSCLFLGSTRKKFDGIETWDTSKVVNMRSMFDDAKYFNHNINSWNVSNVKNMSCMFYHADSFNQNLNDWNVSNVEDMSSMFFAAFSFNEDISNWNTSNVKDMSCMFSYAEVFNCDISNWNTSNVIQMHSMFSNCKKFNQPLNKWDISKVENMLRMFADTESFNQNLNSWNTSNVYGIYAIFENALSFNGNISNWDVSNIKDMEKMFLGAKSFNQDLNNWNVSNAVSMEYMFYNASSFDKENIKEWQLNNVEYINNMFNDIPLYIIFKVYSNINSKKALKELKEYTSYKDIKEVYSMALKYYDKCVIEFVKLYENTYYDELKELIENKETFIKENNKLPEKIKIDKNTVYKPKNKLELINLIKSKVKLNKIDTSSITDMSEVFRDSKLKKFDGIETWDTSNVTKISGMFWGAIYFNHNINSWNTSKVTDMSHMFLEAKSFNQPLDKWDTSNVIDMSFMFDSAESFNQNLESWNVSKVKNMKSMFIYSGMKDNMPSWYIEK